MLIRKVYIDREMKYCVADFNKEKTIIINSIKQYIKKIDATKDYFKRTRISHTKNSPGRFLSIKTREKYGYKF